MSKYTQISGSSFSKVAYYMIWLNDYILCSLFASYIWTELGMMVRQMKASMSYETCEEHLLHFLDQTIIVIMKIIIN